VTLSRPRAHLVRGPTSPLRSRPRATGPRPPPGHDGRALGHADLPARALPGRAERPVRTKLADDGLLPPGVALVWLFDTASMLAAEACLLVTRMLDEGECDATLTRRSGLAPGSIWQDVVVT
jgi:hypothetical protein